MMITAEECNALRKLLANAYRSMPYAEYLKTDHWFEMRNRMVQRTNFRCQLCNKSEHLEVHHNNYEGLGDERLEDLIVLCSECHGKFHDKIEAVRESEQQRSSNGVRLTRRRI